MKKVYTIILFELLLGIYWPTLFNQTAHAQVIWKPLLRTFSVPGSANTYITCINEANEMGGYFTDASGIHGFIYNGIDYQVLDFPGANQTYIYGMNNNKMVVGAYNNNGSTLSNEGFLYNRNTGNWEDVTTPLIPNMDLTIVRDIDDLNTMVGDYKSVGTAHVCFTLWNGIFSMYYFGAQKPTYVNGINNHNKQACYWVDGIYRHGLLYNAGNWEQKDYPGSQKTMFTAINDSNISVGIFNLNQSFLYKKKVNGTDSFVRIIKDGATDFQVRDINNKGIIVGYYKESTGGYKGFFTNVFDNGFRPSPDAWSFANHPNNMWPKAYWFNNFKYDEQDPYLKDGSKFPTLLFSDGTEGPVERESFPDWPLFVDLVGENNCYAIQGKFKKIRYSAFDKYMQIREEYGGSCFGFVQSTFMYRDNKDTFNSQFPKVWNGAISNKKKLEVLFINDDTRRCINYMYLKQKQKYYIDHRKEHYADGPLLVLQKVKEMLIDQDNNDMGLVMRSKLGAHIVNPYKVLPDTNDPDIEYIYIYDNNCGKDTTRRITIFKYSNGWLYNLAVNSTEPDDYWGGTECHVGLYLCLPVRNWYTPTLFEDIPKSSADTIPSMPTVEVFFANTSDLRVNNSQGQSMAYVNGEFNTTIPDAEPIIWENGKQQHPNGFLLPQDEYTLELKNFRKAASELSYSDELCTYRYWRAQATLPQKDILKINYDGLTMENHDTTNKSVNFYVNFKDLDNEMTAEIRNLEVAGDAAASIGVLNNTREIKVINTGGQATYNLNIFYQSAGGDAGFSHDTITITGNATHLIHPNWDSLQTADLTIYVDYGNNGTIDDTLTFSNLALPEILFSPSKFNFSPSGSMDTVFVTNSGGGSLNWTLSSSDTSWLKIISSNSGTDYGWVLLSADANNGASRSGQLVISATGAATTPRRIVCKQSGLLSKPDSLYASDGQYIDTVLVKWKAVTGASYYKVFRSAYEGMDGTEISGWIMDTAFYDTTALKGQYYYYTAKAAQSDSGLNATDFSESNEGFTRCFSADLAFSGQCSGQPTTFINNTIAHTSTFAYWDINADGLPEYTASSLKYTFATPGFYTVRLRVTDSLGCSDIKDTTLGINDFPSISLFKDSTVCVGNTLVLDAGGGFDTYLWSTGATSSSITIDSSGYGLGSSTVYVRLSVGSTCSTLASTNILWDTCANQGGYSLSGIVAYDNTAQTPMNHSSVFLISNGDTLYSDSTDAQGFYSIQGIALGTYQLGFTSHNLWGGVNSTDALKVLRHFTGQAPLEGVRLKSADVNASASVNSIDALLMVKRFVSLIDTFAAGDWAIEDTSIQITGNEQATLNISTVCYGDVDATYLPPSVPANK